MTKTDASLANKGLVHPIYLDIPMMVNFVAALEGGYTLEKTLELNSEAMEEVSGEAAGEVGLSDILSSFVKASLKGSANMDSKQTKAEKSQLVLKHTEASLFMRLRDRLLQVGNRVIALDSYDPNQWGQGLAWQLVEISGYIYRSPINEIIRFGERLIPFIQQSLPHKAGVIDMDNLTPEQKGLVPVIYGLQAVIDDLEALPLSDMFLKHQDGKGSAVLDISTEILPLKEQEKLLCGRVVVLGKATRILIPGEKINLHRRALSGYIDPQKVNELLKQLTDVSGMNLQLQPSMIEYPAIEIIPMAIFV